LFTDYKISSSRLLNYFDSLEKQIVFLCRMMNIVTMSNLSQENISCLNTTIIVLMLANQRNQLPNYLRAIKSKSMEMSLANDIFNLNNPTTVTAGTSEAISTSNLLVQHASTSSSSQRPADIIANFKDLLLFWQSHYLQKDKDCVGLELNSHIEIDYWKSTVDILLDTKNPANECSLYFYMNSEPSRSRTAKNKLDEHRSE
jgi:Trpc4-associated protein